MIRIPGFFILFFLLIYSSLNYCHAQESEKQPPEDVREVLQSRQNLNSLLQKRKEQFGQYTASIEKRTGFLGGKSKKDLLFTTEILSGIIHLDNEIIKNLEKILDYQFFKQTMTQFDQQLFFDRLKNDSIKIERLGVEKQKLIFINSKCNKELKSAVAINKLLWVGIGLLVILILGKMLRSYLK